MNVIPNATLVPFRSSFADAGLPPPCSKPIERPKLPEDDWQRSHAEWGQNRGAVEHLFEALAKELAPRMDGLFLTRPELRKEAFDVSFDNGRIVVVESSLSKTDAAWVEQRLNAGSTLAHHAAAFMAQVVRTYDTAHGTWDTDGEFHRGGFYDGEVHIADYAGLKETVSRTMRFRSLLEDVRSADLYSHQTEADRFSKTTGLVTQYLEKGVTQYVRGPDGTLGTVAERTCGRINNNWLC